MRGAEPGAQAASLPVSCRHLTRPADVYVLMPSQPLMSVSRPLLSALALLLALTGAAQDTRNPFLRKSEEAAAAPAAAAPVENAQLQFCGTYGSGDARRFLIFNVSKNRSVWLDEGEEGPDGEVIQSYDPQSGAVQVSHNGQSLNLALQVATISGAPRPTGPMPTAAQAQTALQTTVKVNPTPADERRRLEAVAAEVRRRRAMRQAAKENQNPVAQPNRR